MKKTIQDSNASWDNLSAFKKGMTPEQAIDFASNLQRLPQKDFYESFLGYIAGANDSAIQSLYNFLTLMKFNKGSLITAETQSQLREKASYTSKNLNIPDSDLEPLKETVKTVNYAAREDFLLLASLELRGLTDLNDLMNGRSAVDITANKSLEEFFEKQVLLHHIQAHDLNNQVNNVYDTMLKSLKDTGFNYYLGYSNDGKKMTSYSEESFSSFQEAERFWSSKEILNVQQKPIEERPKYVSVVSVLKDQGDTRKIGNPAEGFVSSQKLALHKSSGGYEKLTNQPKQMNPDSLVSYYAKLEKLEQKIEDLSQRSWMWRFLERVFGHPKLTDQKKEVLVKVKNKLESEHAALINGTKKIGELLDKDFQDTLAPTNKGKTLDWMKVVSTPSFGKKGKTSTEQVLDEVLERDESTKRSP